MEGEKILKKRSSDISLTMEINAKKIKRPTPKDKPFIRVKSLSKTSVIVDIEC